MTTIKLTDARMQELVNERNEKGLSSTVELMTREELASYRINLAEAIERNEKHLAKMKNPAGGWAQSKMEVIEMLRGYIAYIDSVLASTEVGFNTTTKKEAQVVPFNFEGEVVVLKNRLNGSRFLVTEELSRQEVMVVMLNPNNGQPRKNAKPVKFEVEKLKFL